MGLIFMKKYMVLVAVLAGYSLNAHAASYVFGGRAHFNGALVNPACAIGIDDPSTTSAFLIKENHHEVMLAFTECSPWVYTGLSLKFSDIEQQSQKLLKDANQQIDVAENLIDKQEITKLERGRIYYHYNAVVTGDTEKKMGVVQMNNPTEPFPEKVLLSVVYP